MAQERLYLRAKDQLAIHLCVEQWPDAHSIASKEQAALDGVPDGNGKLPVEVLQTGGAHLLVKMQDDFGVGVCGEAVPAGLELGAQLHIVVDLAVEHDPQGSIFVADRLLPSIEVNDAQASTAKACPPVAEQAKVVWPTMADGAQHAAQYCLVQWWSLDKVQHSGYATHSLVRVPSLTSICSNSNVLGNSPSLPTCLRFPWEGII